MRTFWAAIMMVVLATAAVAQEARSRPAPTDGRVQVPGAKAQPNTGAKPQSNADELQAAKTRAAAEAREKARDTRMRRDMRSICIGC